MATTDAAQITISSEARERASESTGFDEKKVAALKAQVDAGTYRINPQILAARLLEKLG